MKRTAPLVALALVALPSLRGEPSWKNEPPLSHAVAGQAAAIRDGALIVAGGSDWSGNEKQIDDRVQRSDATQPSGWINVAQLPGGFAHGGWASDGESLWLAGGLERSGPSRAVRRIDLTTGRVKTVATLPEPRTYCGSAVLDGALWVVGGSPDEADLSGARATVWRIDLVTQALRALRDPGPAMINPLVLSLGGELHVLPGGVWSATTQRLEPPEVVWIFSPRSERWRSSRLGLATHLPRGLSGAPLDAHRALLAGGFSNHEQTGAIDTRAWIYDSRDSSLTSQPPLPAPRIAAALIPDGHGGAILLGGEDKPRGRAATVWRWSAENGGVTP